MHVHDTSPPLPRDAHRHEPEIAGERDVVDRTRLEQRRQPIAALRLVECDRLDAVPPGPGERSYRRTIRCDQRNRRSICGGR